MPTNDPGHQAPKSTALKSWVHTGIEAPYLLGRRDLDMVELGCGTAFSAEMIHPEHGVVGRIYNTGRGGSTLFDSYDVTTFSVHDLVAFVAQSRHDSEPLDPQHGDVDTLLNEVINEGTYAEQVAEMRRDGLFLVRSYEPRTEDNHGVRRGASLVYDWPVLRRSVREDIAADLVTTPDRLVAGAFWQMFNGQEWVDLLPAPVLTADQTTTRVGEVVALHQATTHPNVSMQAQLLDDGLYAFGMPSAGRFMIFSDAWEVADSRRWCPCPNRRGKPVRFERWSVQDGLLESGTVHGAKSCRRLLTVD